MSDAQYYRELEKAAIDLLVTYRDREAGDRTQLMTIPMGMAALARIVNRGSKNAEHRNHAREVFTSINGRPEWLEEN